MDAASRLKLVAQYSEGPNVLYEAWSEVPEDARFWKPSERDWSAHQIIVHCADSETYAATRIRLLAAEPQPTIVGYNQDEWAIRFNYDRIPAELACAAISAVRALTTQLILEFEDFAWRTSGIHSESGAYSAEDWLRTYAVHLHDHAEQIRANVTLWRSR